MEEIWEILNTPQLTEEDINFACEKLEAFILLNISRNSKERQESIDIMLGSLGLNFSTFTLLRQRLQLISPNSGAVLLGVLVGLWIHESVSLKEQDENYTIPG